MGLGMRGSHVRSFCFVARDFNLIILARMTNDASLAYAGRRDYYPKPAVVKAKTADRDPATKPDPVSGKMIPRAHYIKGLVIHPCFHEDAFLADKKPKVLKCWDDTMAVLCPSLVNIRVDLNDPASVAVWGEDRKGANDSRWSWRVDVDRSSPRFGALQLKRDGVPWSYIHGDYDLKDVIQVGNESRNVRVEGTIDGVKNYEPHLLGTRFTAIQDAINSRIGIPMVQHGSEAQFAWHGDEGIIVIFPNFTHLILGNAEAVESWYAQLKRKTLVSGTSYLGQPSRTFYSGNGVTLPRGQLSFPS